MTDWLPLRDYRRSFAVLMGTWDYEFLGRVPAAEHSLRRMERLLTGPLCGWPQERMLVLPNVPSLGDLPDQLITAFDGITDAALFYFVGHGQISPEDELCMGLAQSRTEPHRRAATSLRFSDVRQALRNCAAAVKIVILDCCFAGLATESAVLAGDVLDLTAGTGAYTMAATSAYTTAWYQDDPGIALPQTYFTKYLADLIEQGIPGQPARLRLDTLFSQLRDNLAADGRPIPRNRAVNDAREFIFAYNAAPSQTVRDPERDLAQLREAADAEIGMLRAQAAERERELARLKAMMAATAQHDTGQRRELQESIDAAARQLDDNQAAQTTAALLGDRLAGLRPATAQTATGRPGSRSSRGRASIAATAPRAWRRAAPAIGPLALGIQLISFTLNWSPWIIVASGIIGLFLATQVARIWPARVGFSINFLGFALYALADRVLWPYLHAVMITNDCRAAMLLLGALLNVAALIICMIDLTELSWSKLRGSTNLLSMGFCGCLAAGLSFNATDLIGNSRAVSDPARGLFIAAASLAVLVALSSPRGGSARTAPRES
jgi:hypothetical protein